MVSLSLKCSELPNFVFRYHLMPQNYELDVYVRETNDGLKNSVHFRKPEFNLRSYTLTHFGWVMHFLSFIARLC